MNHTVVCGIFFVLSLVNAVGNKHNKIDKVIWIIISILWVVEAIGNT